MNRQRPFQQMNDLMKRGLPKGKYAFTGTGLLLALGLAGFAVQTSLFNVDGGHRAIKYSRIGGIKNLIYPEGTHFLIPWIETAIDYDVRAKPRNISSLTGTKGRLQELKR